MKRKFVISFDMDWAPDEVIEYTLSVLDKYKIKATLFMTNKTAIDLRDHEIAIHPNYTSLDFDKHLSEMLSLFPGSKGVRSHSLFFSERLRPFYEKYGIIYQSNVMMYLQPNINRLPVSKECTELPIFLMDSFHVIMQGKKVSFNPNDLNLESEGLKIFDFHPVHVYLNTSRIEDYEKAKLVYHQPQELWKHRNSLYPGVNDLLENILGYIRSEKTGTYTALELAM